MIRVSDFSKWYDRTRAVDQLSFELEGGAVLGMVGQNGAGKTTTLRTLAGIIPPTSGQLTVGGYDIVKQPQQAKRCIAYVPDEPNLFEYLTVWEHLQFYASAFRVRNWQQKAEELLVKFELTAKRNATASELSRGMRQKVAISTRFLYEPRAILFDEPHSGLDPHGIRTMKQAILDFSRDGVSIIISSHLLSLIDDLCTHLMILDAGTAKFFGTIEELKATYPAVGDDHSLEQIFFQATKAEEGSSLDND